MRLNVEVSSRLVRQAEFDGDIAPNTLLINSSRPVNANILIIPRLRKRERLATILILWRTQ